MFSRLREIPNHGKLCPRAVVIGGRLLQRAYYFKIMTKTETKKQAQQELCTADHINNPRPPVQLGIMVQQNLPISVGVLNHSIESMLTQKSSSLGIARSTCHRDPSSDVHYTVPLPVW